MSVPVANYDAMMKAVVIPSLQSGTNTLFGESITAHDMTTRPENWQANTFNFPYSQNRVFPIPR